jgi:outer membrane receptor protein involved in Fe transport
VGYQEGAYVQDELTLAKWLVFDGGVRLDAIQDRVSGYHGPTTPTWVPAWGSASFLRMTPSSTSITASCSCRPRRKTCGTPFKRWWAADQVLAPYDIKPETDDYFETGLAQQVATQLFTLNAYYKSATNMLDETQLLNTGISQPYNFATGYAYGVEFSARGQLDKDWSDFANYSYEIAEGEGISGGLFAFSPAQAAAQINAGYQFLDHCQINTANVGLTYNPGDIWITAEGLYGGGLSTGPTNNERLPDHLTMDTTFGYAFKKDSGLEGMKASLDVLNVFNDPYVIFIDNGYNGNHYENGREFIFHLSKSL